MVFLVISSGAETVTIACGSRRDADRIRTALNLSIGSVTSDRAILPFGRTADVVTFHCQTTGADRPVPAHRETLHR